MIKITILTLSLTSLLYSSLYAENPLLMEISSENLYDGSIKVLFILSEVNNPKMFFYKGKTPKVVCDFANVAIKPGLKEDIRVNKRFIKGVRMGEHLHPTRKVRVVLDLVPGKEYSVREIPPEPNIFAVIIRSDDDNSNQASGVQETSINELESTKPSTDQHTYSYQTTTTTTITTIPTTTIAKIRNENIETAYNQIEEDTPDEDEADKDDEDIDDEENVQKSLTDTSWQDRLLKAAEGQEPPYRWPIEKSFGKLKMIVHLDTDPNGFLCLKGYIINMSDDFFYRIQLGFDLFNSEADVVEKAYGDFFNVEPGERRKMSIHIAGKTASNFHLMDQLFW